MKKEMKKEFAIRMIPIDRTLQWQRPNAATQRPVDSREVENPWNRDRTRPVNPNWTQPEFGASYLHRLRSTGRWIAM